MSAAAGSMRGWLPVNAMASAWLVAVLLVFAAEATAAFAPVGRPGPPLRTPAAEMRAAMVCEGELRSAPEPVLLVPGTAFDYESQYSWSWGPALSRAGIAWCAVSPPESQLGDLTVAGEYDAFAIRRTYRLAGRRPIAVVGHSQGGMQPRWAFRFWPDVRNKVADHVGVAPDNQGASAVEYFSLFGCGASGCPQGIWQQRPSSDFIAAVNSRQETFGGIDYSVIYSEADGLVQPADTVLHPAPGSSYRRVSLQDRCPTNNADHLRNGSVDALTFAMIVDAIAHDGPVDPERISESVCSQTLLPGLDPADALAGTANAPLQIATAVAAATYSDSEAELPCYALARCGLVVGKGKGVRRADRSRPFRISLRSRRKPFESVRITLRRRGRQVGTSRTFDFGGQRRWVRINVKKRLRSGRTYRLTTTGRSGDGSWVRTVRNRRVPAR